MVFVDPSGRAVKASGLELVPRPFRKQRLVRFGASFYSSESNAWPVWQYKLPAAGPIRPSLPCMVFDLATEFVDPSGKAVKVQVWSYF